MAENTCCGALEKLEEDYGWPFYRPITINRENHNLERGGWSAKLFYKTAAGAISKKHSPSAVLNYCPFCGKRLVEE